MKKLLIFLIPFLLVIYLVLDYLRIIPRKVYYAKDFDIEIITSNLDYNKNGIDDYTEILNGALKEAKRHPKYKSVYYSGGYPPDNEGVCTDLIWRSLKEAGYDFKQLIDDDIKNNLNDYKNITKIDSNIDFRRVPNIQIFLKQNTLVLTNNIKEITQFQPGDIVVFSNNHIAVISNKRNKKGIPYIIHNAGQINFEEDTFERWDKKEKITGHYRFFLS